MIYMYINVTVYIYVYFMLVYADMHAYVEMLTNRDGYRVSWMPLFCLEF